MGSAGSKLRKLRRKLRKKRLKLELGRAGVDASDFKAADRYLQSNYDHLPPAMREAFLGELAERGLDRCRELDPVLFAAFVREMKSGDHRAAAETLDLLAARTGAEIQSELDEDEGDGGS